MQFDSRDARLALAATMVLLVTMVFTADLMTRLGIAVWVFYLLPIALSLFQDRPAVPFVTAGVSTLLIVAGYLLSPPGMSPEIAQVNRVLGSIVLWVSAGIAFMFIVARNDARLLASAQEARAALAGRWLGDNEPERLATDLLQSLCAHLGASVGVMHERDGDGLRRLATWALPDAASLPLRTEPGAGLAGQCLVDGRAMRIEPVPQPSIRAGATLATTAPASLVVAPMTAQGRVTGVVELGFAGEARAWKALRAVLEQCAEPLGMALRAANDRRRLQTLLAETERQREVLEAQQEELRASNEELHAQGEALHASQTRLELQHAELEQAAERMQAQNRELEVQRESMQHAQAALRRHADEIERAGRYKSEFLANMSHELRTPLNSSLILSKLLADNRGGTLTPEQVRHARTIVSANQDLLALINDVLDLAKIEAGRATVEVETVEVAAFAESLRATFGPQARERGLAFEVAIADDAPRAIATDPQRLRQVLGNFLSNALKFTDQGGVGVDVTRAGADGIAFTVSDTGIGIDPSQHETIFEAFRQADGSTSRRYGGTGLGLSISRELAQLLGGSITLDSAPGRGSRFTLLLPVGTPDSERAPVAAQGVAGSGVVDRGASGMAGGAAGGRRVDPGNPGIRGGIRDGGSERASGRADAGIGTADGIGTSDNGDTSDGSRASDGLHAADGLARRSEALTPLPDRCILVVEDDPAFARILCDLAAELDFVPSIAGTASEALDAVHRAPPAAILLDVGLPDGSGLSLLERLKREPAARHVPIHVVSVSDFRQTAMELGAVGYALKPADREQLVEVLRSLDERLRRSLRRVLIVEDDARLRESVRALLAADGVELVDAGTVAQARALLDESTFDCVVLDLVLPDGSGYDLLERLAAAPAGTAPPVIVYTGRALDRDEEHRVRRLARSIIVKGARSPERLLDEVTLFLHQVESRLPVDKQRLLQQARERDRAFEGRTILLAEDDARNIFALSSVLEPLGAQVLVARDGHEAIARLGEHEVDLVLMDVMMPGMDGLAAMRAIRAGERGARLPILALTAKAMPDDRAACLEAGADDYLAKPIDVDRLLSLCRVWMPK